MCMYIQLYIALSLKLGYVNKLKVFISIASSKLDIQKHPVHVNSKERIVPTTKGSCG